jgi:type II secretory pathway component PulF
MSDAPLDYAVGHRPGDPLPSFEPESGGGAATLAILRFIGWRLLTAGVIALLVGGMWFSVSPFLAVLSPVLIIVFFPELAGLSTRVRRQRATVILSYLEQAARLNLPLPRMLDAAQLSEEHRTADRLRRVRDLLEDGAPLEMALRLGAPEVSARAVSLVGAAERIGRLPQTLARLVDEQRELPEEAERGAFARWYPLMMCLTMTLLIGLMMIFVMPKLEAIYRDFGLKLPPITQWVMRTARAFAGDEVPWALLALVLVAVGILGGAFERIFTPPQQIWQPRWTDYVLWFVPLVHGAARDRGMADACQTIGSALRSGRGLDRAIAQAAEVRMNVVLQKRLRRWGEDVASGLHAADAARQARLPELLAGMVGPGRGTSLPAVMDFLAAYYGGRFSRLRELLRGASVPAIVFFFAIIVVTIICAMYVPVITLMNSISSNPMKGPS